MADVRDRAGHPGTNSPRQKDPQAGLEHSESSPHLKERPLRPVPFVRRGAAAGFRRSVAAPGGSA